MNIILGDCFTFLSLTVPKSLLFSYNIYIYYLDSTVEDTSNTELLDLGFDAPEPPASAGQQAAASENWLLDDQFAGLGRSRDFS